VIGHARDMEIAVHTDRQTLWGQMSRVAQASGMVSVQADCSCDAAMTLMQAEADR